MKSATEGAPRRIQSGLAWLFGALLLLLLVSAPAQAAFTRPFVRQITGPSPSEHFHGPYGVAVDGEDDLWVSDSANHPAYQLYRFKAGSSEFLETLNIAGSEPPEPEGLTPPDDLAIDQASGVFYTTNEISEFAYQSWLEEFDSSGTYIRRILHQISPRAVAVDNSAGPTAGDVYVAGESSSVGRFDSEGNAVDFTCGLSCSEYVQGNKITGIPGHVFSARALTVDSKGNLYVVDQANAQVDEFSASGQYVRSFTGAETPGVGEETEEHGGYGGNLIGVAVDPLNGHVLVSLQSSSSKRLHPEEGAIDEFDSSGHFVNQLATTKPGHRLVAPAEMAFASDGTLYVVDGKGVETEHAVDVFDPGAFLPTLTIAPHPEHTASTAILKGTVDPENRPLSKCAFEYVTEAAFAATGFEDLSSGGEAPCGPGAGEIPADEMAHAVQAELSGLTSGITYRYRLVATSSGELSGTAASQALAFTAVHAPRVESTSALNVSSAFAELRGMINPLGADTQYQFQYVDSAHYQPEATDPFAEALSVPVPASDIGSGGLTGSEPASVVQQIGGLTPSTTYHFRIVATNVAGETDGEREGEAEVPHTFSTLPEPSVGLPDGRAYELVTPADKGTTNDLFSRPLRDGEYANGIVGSGDDGFASESGSQFYLSTTAAFGSFPASALNAYVFSRRPDGWQAISLASPSLGVQSIAGTESIFDPSDLSRLGLDATVGSLSNAAGSRVFNLLGPPGGPYATLHVDAPPPSPGAPATERSKFVGGSADLETTVLETSGHSLCPVSGEAETKQDEGSHVLCEYTNGGEPTLVNINGSGKLLSRCGAALGLRGVGADGLRAGEHAVSGDGSRIFFTAPDPNSRNDGPGCWNGEATNAPQLYLRSGGETIEVSAPEPSRAAEKGHHPAIYVGAAADGSRVFFLSEGDLTADSVGIHDLELYEYDLERPEGERLTRISSGESGFADADVAFVGAVSADGSAVYFAARGQLTGSAPPAGPKVPKSAPETLNLYRYATAAGNTEFVTQVNKIDYPDDGIGAWWGTNMFSNRQVALTGANWYATPNGRFLLFASKGDVTSYDSTQASGVVCPRTISQQAEEANGHCDEVYRYDALTHALTCISCNPGGARPVSNALFARSALPSASGIPRALSNDGSTAFFDTADPLVPQDNNGTLDVYEWHDGTISLISSGHDSKPSYYLGSSSNGSDVFIGTHARLVPEDTDAFGDVYDARACSASEPCLRPPASGEGLCEGDACAAPVPAPNDPTPGSLSYSGSGNEPPHKARKPRRHHRRKHHKPRKRAQSTHRRAHR